MSIAVLLALVAANLAVVAIVQSKGSSLLAWAVLALAAIHLVGLL